MKTPEHKCLAVNKTSRRKHLCLQRLMGYWDLSVVGGIRILYVQRLITLAWARFSPVEQPHSVSELIPHKKELKTPQKL